MTTRIKASEVKIGDHIKPRDMPFDSWADYWFRVDEIAPCFDVDGDPELIFKSVHDVDIPDEYYGGLKRQPVTSRVITEPNYIFDRRD